MDITFEICVNGKGEKKRVKIFNNGKEIGSIFTPAGSGEDEATAIQVCGFDYAYDLWGCGRYIGEKDGKAKKDIQLMFNPDSKRENITDINCEACFNEPCTCDNKGDLSAPNVHITHGERVRLWRRSCK